MDSIGRYDVYPVPAFDAFSAREAAARLAAADEGPLLDAAEAAAQTFVRGREEIRAFPGYDEIRETEELVLQKDGRTEVRQIAFGVYREPRPERLDEDRAEPGLVLDLTV